VSKQGGLGRGLASLIPTGGQSGTGDQKELPIDQVFPNPDQPRTAMGEDGIADLADSIKQVGVLQPVIVRPRDAGYQIIAGERRWRAARAAGLESIPVRIMHADETQALELALIENLQRQDLNPVEEARGYRRLLSEYDMTQAELAEKVSKSRSAITNALRLLDLPEDVQELLYNCRLSAGHARAVLSVPDEEKRVRLANKIVESGLSVREAENLARLYLAGEAERSPRPVAPKSYKLVARLLRKRLGTAVRVKQTQNKGKIEIDFQNEEELERIYKALSTPGDAVTEEGPA
jgi:ParB family transcriptional regulator, chromosome partitioning protein